MTRIEEVSTQIREHTYPWNSDMRNRYFQSRHDDWNLLCVAMDTLDDTCLALEDYEAEGLGTASGGKYLRLYGMLQAVFLQQDCICTLHKMFRDVNEELFAPAILAAEELATDGHPTEAKNALCFLARNTREPLLHRAHTLQMLFRLGCESDGRRVATEMYRELMKTRRQRCRRSESQRWCTRQA